MSILSPILCFVCEKTILSDDIFYHPKVNLPICDACSGSESEVAKVEELLEGLAEGLICGCI
jgi:hypothetical protein